MKARVEIFLKNDDNIKFFFLYLCVFLDEDKMSFIICMFKNRREATGINAVEKSRVHIW